MCPPGVDQTMRLPQRWRLIAPNIQQSDCLSGTEEIWRFEIRSGLFNSEVKCDAWSKLARPVVPSQSAKATASLSANVTGADKHTERSKISTLPSELILMLLESGDLSKVDIVSLALASPSLRPIIISHIQSSYRKVAAPWARTPIAILGNYSEDLPTSFKDDEVVLQTYAQWDSGRGSISIWSAGRMLASRRYFHAAAGFPKPITPRIEERAWRDALTELANQNRHYSHAEFRSIDEQLAYSNLFPQHKKWVLRNLTTKEYYITQPFSKKDNWQKRPRSHKRPKTNDELAPPRMLRFDDVMLLRTCWTSIYHQKDLKGKWAGHCFDVVTTDTFDDEGREGWTDVSEELLVEAKTHWEHRSTMYNADSESHVNMLAAKFGFKA